ncbi:Dynein light chain 1 cytoplasmic [Taenia crassiceps]|uniref:Dynein light chain n=1 Tax=Taenia crassiceps TaxID=6207 RepID=A0ABR4QN14_9CEST
MYKQQEKLEVRSTKMSRDMERDALETARRAFEKNPEPRAVANMIKKEFDQRYTPNWHCIVGNHFGSFITHVENNFIYFTQGKTAILLWKTA